MPSKGQLLQLQIQALKVTESGYKNNSSKFIMTKSLEWGMLCLCTLIFYYDIQKNALKIQYYYPDLIPELQNTLLTYSLWQGSPYNYTVTK